MPIPKPNRIESKDDFISRCMGDDIMNNEYQEQDQRMAVCNTQWEKKKLSDIKELFSGGYESVKGIEILNQFPNTHKLKFDDNSFDEFIKNFSDLKGKMQPNLAISHSDQQIILKELFEIENVELGEELPNLGFVERLYREGKSLFADIGKVPKKLKEILFGGRLFKSISPELVYNWRDTGKKVITSLRLTNNPSQKHIYDVHMGEASRGGAPRYDGKIIFDGGQDMADETKDVKIETEDKGAISKLSEKINSFIDSFKKEKKDEEQKTIKIEGGEETIPLSEFNKFKDSVESVMNELKLKLMEKDKNEKHFSEQITTIRNNSRLEKADAICKQALLDGVPPIIIEQLKPVLLSETGEKTVKFSAVIDGEKVEAEKTLTQIVKDVFKHYPSKVDFSEHTKVELSSPSDDDMKKINARTKELMSEGMSKHEALMEAGIEIRGG